MLGSGVSSLAFPLLVLALTHSPGKTGLAAALFGFPYIFLSLPVGALVDRWDRKRVMLISDSARAVNMLAIPIVAALGSLTLSQVYLAALVEGIAFVFFNVAEVAALPRVVAPSQIPSAAAQNQAAQTASAIVAPPLGGILFQVAGRAVPFLADAISYAVSVISLLFIRVEFQLDREAPRGRLLHDIVEGVVWLWGQPLIRFMTVLSGGLNFCNQGMFLIILILARQQGASPALIGGMFAIAAVGGLIGSLLAPRIQRRFGYGQVITTMVWLVAVASPLFALAPNVVVLGLLEAVVFLTGPIYVTVQFSHRLALIPDELQGRVNSAVRLVAFGMVPAGTAAGGLLVQAAGVVTSILMLSAGVLALAILTTVNKHIRAVSATTPATRA